MGAPPIVVEDMSEAEAAEYLEAMLPGYAAEMAKAMEMPLPEALEGARRQIASLLPDGPATRGHHFKVVRLPDGAQAGILWYAHDLRPDLPRLFLYDIVIEEGMRGRGLGTACMRWLETEGRRLGAPELGLAVVHHNEGAVRLYRRLGYEVLQAGTGGMRMIKRLGDPNPGPDR